MMKSFIICTLYLFVRVIQSKREAWEKDKYEILFGSPQKKMIWKPGYRWEDNI
jgi:hypothetical protein